MTKNLLSTQPALGTVTVMLLIIIVTASCMSPTEQVSPALHLDPTTANPVAFQNIIKGYALTSNIKEPVLLMASDESSLEKLASFLSRKDQKSLKQIDFKQEVVIAVFLGIQPSGGISITINNISINGSELTVSLQVQEHDPNFPKIDAATLPYHLVKINRESLPDNISINYRLVDGDEILATGEVP